jgi:hypothetical protein
MSGHVKFEEHKSGVPMYVHHVMKVLRESGGKIPYILHLDTTSVFHKLFFSPVVHPNLSKTHDGTPQNVASRTADAKLYMAMNMYQHTNTCPIRMQAYKKNHYTCWMKLLMMNQCVCVCARA